MGRLRFPNPGDPFGPTEGFVENAIRLPTLGYTYLELSEIMGNSAARQHIHREMANRGTLRGNPHFANHWAEYRESYAGYKRQLRDFPHQKKGETQRGNSMRRLTALLCARMEGF